MLERLFCILAVLIAILRLKNLCIFWIKPSPFYLIAEQAETLAMSVYSMILKNLDSIVVPLDTCQFILDCTKNLPVDKLIAHE